MSTEAGFAAAAKVIRANGVEIATESFGDPSHPPVLLVMGAMASMLWWPDEFCRRLASRGRHVIRYDNRDTGLSTTWEPGKPAYSFDDMADDVLRVLDGHGLTAAHLVGMSMGGAIAQLAALEYPQRVLTLTALSTSPIDADRSRLPGSTPAYATHSSAATPPDWSDRDATIAYMVDEMRLLAGPARPFDEAATRQLVGRDFDRAASYASAANHYALPDGNRQHPPLRDLKVPLLVIHGAADPLFPIEHGEAFLQAVPGARLVRLEGGGHELDEAHWLEIIGAIVAHTERDT